MARVEWAALGGDEVEAVVSNLLYNAHPRAVRIRPAQGDFGIDVLVPHGASETRDVYQIKKFATNLTASQKTQIVNSFKRVLIGLVRGKVSLGDWYLTMPLDPTPDNLEWFEGMPEDAIQQLFTDKATALTPAEKGHITTWMNAPGRIIEWRGLLFCEALVSKYWFVPDYYLHGGSERIKSATAEVAKILQRDVQIRPQENSTSILTPAEITEHLRRLQGTLDGDPHFRYGVALDPQPPALLVEPGLVAATQESSADGSTITFKIFERFAEALNERPVPIKVRVQLEKGSAEEKDFNDWRKYGKSLHTSAAAVEADLPGGLGGTMNGSVKISAANPEKFDLRYRIAALDGEVLAEVPVAVSLTSGLETSGAWSRATDPSGFLTLETLADTSDKSVKLSLSLGELAGQDPTSVLPAIEFATNFVRPNILMVARKRGPFHRAGEISNADSLCPLPILRYVRALSVVQSLTPVPLAVPKLETVTEHDVRETIRVASLIEGKTFISKWTEMKFELGSSGTSAVIENDHVQLSVLKPLTVTVGAQEINLGCVEVIMLSAKVETGENGSIIARPHLNDTVHEAFAPHETTPPDSRLPVRSRPAAAESNPSRDSA